MALEIPHDLIRKLQQSTREKAGVSQYDPDDESLLKNFTTLRDSIADLDPTAPTYLRCKHCQGKFLRGLQTMVCIYCGAEQRRDGLPQTISFNATVGCRWLLESLDLDPSDHITLHSDTTDSRKSEGAVKKVMFLSDLLDLEIAWPSDKEEPERSALSKMPCHSTPMDFSVVDLDKSISKEKPLEPSSVSSVPKDGLPKGHVKLPENFASFETIQSKETLQVSVQVENTEFGDSFADWEPDFHSANLENPTSDSKTSVHSQNFTSDTCKQSEGDLSFHDGGHSELSSSKIDDNSPMTSEWIPDDLWQTAGIKISDSDKADRESISDDFLPVAASRDSKEVHGTLEKNDDDDNDDWNDFTIAQASTNSSTHISENANVSVNDKKKNANDFDTFDDQKNVTIPQGSAFDSWAHIGEESNKIPNETMLKETNLDGFFQSGPSVMTPVKNGRMPDMSQNMEFGSFLESGDSGPSGTAVAEAKNDVFNQDDFTLKDVNSERTIDSSTTAEGTEGVRPEFTSLPTVDDLLSRMNDLSFMLQDNLSIPSNTKNNDSTS